MDGHNGIMIDSTVGVASEPAKHSSELSCLWVRSRDTCGALYVFVYWAVFHLQNIENSFKDRSWAAIDLDL
jgi:hypothetical protein